MNRFVIIDRKEPGRDRWVPGDRYLRPAIRRLIRGPHIPGGLDRVQLNLCRGLDEIGVRYAVNPSIDGIRDEDLVTVLGRGGNCLDGYDRSNRIMAGIGLMTHPAEWPNLFEEYPVVRYLQHCEWVRRLYASYYGNTRVTCWPVGIDTYAWTPTPDRKKTTDFLLYDKIRWEHSRYERELINPILATLRAHNLSSETLRYGSYDPNAYRTALSRCRAMLFLCEHESQGIAYQEAMSAGVPVLAWDQGWWLDPNRFKWNAANTPATSVPFFDQRCGIKFQDGSDFSEKLELFLHLMQRGAFDPRSYVTENLTLAKCASHFTQLAKEVL